MALPFSWKTADGYQNSLGLEPLEALSLKGRVMDPSTKQKQDLNAEDMIYNHHK